MSRGIAWVVLILVGGTLGGCPQDAIGPNGDGAERAVPGQDGPTQGGERLEGPGFSLVLPSGLVLKEKDTPHPGLVFWCYYEDAVGMRGIAVGVYTPAGGSVSNLEAVSLRVKGATQSATGDFLLVARITASSVFGFESEGAVGLLANGNALVVQVASLNLSGVDELVAANLFTSVDLVDSDGRGLEQRWRDSSTTLLSKTPAGLVVLSDLSVWSLYADKTSAETAEIEAWGASDPVFAQILSATDGVERGELVHVGRWFPVEVFKVGLALDATIVQSDAGVVHLSDDTAWAVGADMASLWNVGDRILRVHNGETLMLVHPSTGRVIVNAAQAIVGDGFSVILPAGPLQEVTDSAPPADTMFWRAFYDASYDISYAVAVYSAEASGGNMPIEQLTARIRGSIITTTGDFLLLARFGAASFNGFEADVAIGTLADGRLIYVYLLADRIGAAEELAAVPLFLSIDLFNTDGRLIESKVADAAEDVIVRGSNGMVVLSDFSVWSLSYSPTHAQSQEFNRWMPGDKLILQTYRKTYASTDTLELLHVGRWIPVEVDEKGTASDTTIAAIVSTDIICLSDGSLWRFAGSVPSAWSVGRRVFRVLGDYGLSEWLILVDTGSAVEFF